MRRGEPLPLFLIEKGFYRSFVLKILWSGNFIFRIGILEFLLEGELSRARVNFHHKKELSQNMPPCYSKKFFKKISKKVLTIICRYVNIYTTETQSDAPQKALKKI